MGCINGRRVGVHQHRRTLRWHVYGLLISAPRFYRLSAEICTFFGVDKAGWAAPEASAQMLDDRASPYQASFRTDQSARRTEAMGIRTIGDLAGSAPRLAIGSNYEFFARPE